jgi:hypothetical protein
VTIRFFTAAAWIAVLDEGEQAGPRRAATHRNFELLTAAGARLGGIPPILTADDCCAPGGPHEHAVIGCVTPHNVPRNLFLEGEYLFTSAVVAIKVVPLVQINHGLLST